MREQYNPMALNSALLKTLGAGGLAFLITGLLLHWVIPRPKVTLLIDRSYCSEAEWQRVAAAYSDLYYQHQRRQLQLKLVVLASPLGLEHLSEPPSPQTVQQLSSYGRFDQNQRATLQSTFSTAEILSCHF